MGLLYMHIRNINSHFKFMLPCALVFLLAKMDDAAARTNARKMIGRGTTALLAVALHVAGFLVIMAVLLWTIRSGFEVAAGTQRYTDDEEGCSQWAFHVGVVTIFFGFLFLALGIPILAYLFLKLSERLQQQEKQNGIHPGSNMKANISPWIYDHHNNLTLRFFFTFFSYHVLVNELH